MSERALTVTSSLFAEGETIPSSAAHGYAGGENISPDLSWSAGPEGTRSYAITVWDPDAPTEIGFVHWILFDIPADVTSLPAGAGAAGGEPAGSTLGFTDWGESQYGGMAPPPGDEPHRYVFTVHALDVPKLELPPTATLAFLRFNMRGHVLAKGALTGRFGLS
jgi:Raf kinase inhibitor-like YbhB/YbcL family protein